MASSGKPKTTMAKLQREAALRERRVEKARRKQIRKQGQLDQRQGDELDPETSDSVVDSSGSESEPDVRL